MQETKKCVRCKTINPGKKTYCVKCGTFLPSNSDAITRKSTIWDDQLGSVTEGNMPVINTPVVDTPVHIAPKPSGNNGRSTPEKYVVVCPECNQVIPVKDGIMPMFCGSCSYPFQVGIDKIIPASALKKQNADGQNQAGGSNGQYGNSQDGGGAENGATSIPHRRNPMPRAQSDTTRMRLISLTRKDIMPASINPNGDILGENGTVMKYICTSQQLSITHARTGWYVMVLKGQPLYNGSAMNSGIQKKLYDRDILTIGMEQIRVEIVQNGNCII